MNRSRDNVRIAGLSLSFCLGVAMVAGASPVRAGGLGDEGLIRTAGRCDYNSGMVDMGNGTCGRSAAHLRVGTRNVGNSAWSGGTSNAGLRSDGSGLVPGAGDSTHLRIRNGIGALSPFN